jgi:hypothetical protein
MLVASVLLRSKPGVTSDVKTSGAVRSELTPPKNVTGVSPRLLKL